MDKVKQIIDRVVQILDNGGQTQVTFSAGDWQALNDLVTPAQAETPAEAPAHVEEAPAEPAEHSETKE